MTKYNASKESIDGITFDSKAEAEFYRFLKTLESEGAITSIKVHPKYVLQKSFVSDIRNERAIIYEADFEIVGFNGNVEVIDIKGMATPEAKLKRKMFLYLNSGVPLHWIVKNNKYSTCGWLDYFILEKMRKYNKKGKKL